MNICFNGKLFPANHPVLLSSNRSFKWGDGLFETMKILQGKLLWADFHFERLFSGLQLLEINKAALFTQEILQEKILRLCQHNNCEESARIRLAVYRDDENQTGYVIEATPLDKMINEWQENGLVLGLYPYARKTVDAFANIKSANFLPYVLAQRFADASKRDDAIVLNIHNMLCDTARANIFVVKDQVIHTPALHQGCVSGVMRRVIIDEVKKLGFRLYEDELSEEQLLQSDEVFLTNAIQGVRWVQSYKEKQYKNAITKKIFDAVVTSNPLLRIG